MNKALILKRLKEVKNFETDRELSNFLGISKSTLSNWRARNSIDFELLFSKCEQINVDWLLTGQGEMIKKTKSKKNVIVLNDNINDNAIDTKRKVKKMLSFQEKEPSPPDHSRNEIMQLLKENKKLVEEKNKLLENENERLNNEVSRLTAANSLLSTENANLQAQNKDLATQINNIIAENIAFKKGIQNRAAG